MLSLSPFEVHHPTTVSEAVQLKSTLPNSFYLAGGTDLLVNLKHKLHQADHVVSLARIDELQHASPTRIGAMVTLETVATMNLGALSQAAGLVAGPHHRAMGTLGGNVLLDTRCLFYNQSEPWREALGHCLKKDGTWCHVIGSAKGCVAAQSSDTVPALLALGASLHLQTPEGPTTLDLEQLYTTDGRFERMHSISSDALLVAVELPKLAGRSCYRKVRARASIDFPVLGVAVQLQLPKGIVHKLRIVLGALTPKPRVVGKLDAFIGQPLDDAAIAEIAAKSERQARPYPSVHGDEAWRKRMVSVEVARALRALRDPDLNR